MKSSCSIQKKSTLNTLALVIFEVMMIMHGAWLEVSLESTDTVVPG
jgi:hypothetical protein